jgi:beta-glucosidase
VLRPTWRSSDITLEPASIGTSDNFNVTVTVANTGDRDGKEVVQVYMTDVFSSVVTPNQQLVGFQKVDIPCVPSILPVPLRVLTCVYSAGESVTVSIEVLSSQLAVWGLNNAFVVEPGTFVIKVGTSDEEFASATLTVHG